MRFAVQYRVEKKKIIRSNIDLARFVLRILDRLAEGPVTASEFKALYMGESEGEAQYAKWV